MTDINGHQVAVDDIICMAFRSGDNAQLRKGRVLEVYPGDPNAQRWTADAQTRVKIQWLASSYMGLPGSKATTVRLRDYVIIS